MSELKPSQFISRAEIDDAYDKLQSEALDFIGRLLAEPSIEKNLRIKNMLLERVGHINSRIKFVLPP